MNDDWNLRASGSEATKDSGLAAVGMNNIGATLVKDALEAAQGKKIV
jgi:hypothetical protein